MSTEGLTRLAPVPLRVPHASIDLHVDTRGLRREKGDGLHREQATGGFPVGLP